MLQFNISSNADQVIDAISRLKREKLPRAISNAANQTGRYVHSALLQEMKEVFDRPTPWALGGLRFKLATDAQPYVRIWLEEFGGKGTPAAKFLSAEIKGGPRAHKRFEKALIAKGLMRGNEYAVPAYGAPQDAYGNVPGHYIVRMLSDLQAFGEQGYRANRKGERRGKRRYNYWFGVRTGDSVGLKPGIYYSSNANLPALVFAFTRTPQYRKRYDFYGKGQAAIDRVALRFLKEAVEKAIRRDNYPA